ncbi:MAG: DEAD/DEAH box helicase, partial [Methanomicrobiaceae archaeon]|nr:DEAD/DEAH box helicase [Methanomicrobiaceae archaeon]
MPAREMIAHLSGSPRHRPYIVHIEALPPRPPRYGTLLRPLPEAIEAYLARKGIRLYTHQCEAVDRLRRNEDIIITTSTASGKTLAFNLPVFERLFEDPAATALYLYPTKALANDQQKAIRELEAFTGIDAGTAVYDGDTPQHRRAAIRERARLVISNPYEMHQILPWHPKWGRFLSGLSYIVIDEAHRYRGVFGSHIAGMIRRLRRICGYYGSNPVFILSTATIANPAEFARRLTGREAAWVGDDGSPHGTKHFVLYNPFADRAEARPAHLETKDLFVACVRQGCRTLCFTASRRMAEVVALGAKDGLRAAGRADQVAAYRAGYLPQERRAIEDGLKEGPLAGVVSTNALELGIDIGSLDGVIISGYPGTMISVWQQAGRAGRQAAESFAILVAFSNPLDQYFMRHPQAFFARPHEHAVIDTENPCILSGHLLCAAAELPLDPGRDAAYFGSDLLAMADSLQAHHLIRKSTRGWVYAGRGRAVDAVRLDALSSETFRIVCNGRLLETMDRRQAYREAHPGALLLHQGETYAVADMDPD